MLPNAWKWEELSLTCVTQRCDLVGRGETAVEDRVNSVWALGGLPPRADLAEQTAQAVGVAVAVNGKTERSTLDPVGKKH